jgi:hypothetical protein
MVLIALLPSWPPLPYRAQSNLSVTDSRPYHRMPLFVTESPHHVSPDPISPDRPLGPAVLCTAHRAIDAEERVILGCLRFTFWGSLSHLPISSPDGYTLVPPWYWNVV